MFHPVRILGSNNSPKTICLLSSVYLMLWKVAFLYSKILWITQIVKHCCLIDFHVKKLSKYHLSILLISFKSFPPTKRNHQFFLSILPFFFKQLKYPHFLEFQKLYPGTSQRSSSICLYCVYPPKTQSSRQFSNSNCVVRDNLSNRHPLGPRSRSRPFPLSLYISSFWVCWPQSSRWYRPCNW